MTATETPNLTRSSCEVDLFQDQDDGSWWVRLVKIDNRDAPLTGWHKVTVDRSASGRPAWATIVEEGYAMTGTLSDEGTSRGFPIGSVPVTEALPAWVAVDVRTQLQDRFNHGKSI